MTRASKAIALVLISSSLGVGGALAYDAWVRHKQEDEENKDQAASSGGGGGHVHGYTGGHYYRPWYYGTGSVSRPRPAPAPHGPSRAAPAVHSGGFGSTGHAVVAGS